MQYDDHVIAHGGQFVDKPSEYLNNYRINQSKILLRETDKSIVTIAQDCGFFDSSHFIRFFSKKESVSPMKYRLDFIDKVDYRK